MIRLPNVSRTTVLIGLTTFGAIALIVGLSYLIRHRGDSDVLPPAVVMAIKAEKAGRATIDSTVKVSIDTASSAHADRDSLEARALRAEKRARVISHRADSLAAEARASATARDSATYWHLAYAARTSERDALLFAIDTLHTALARADVGARALSRGLFVADSGRRHADSVLDATVAAAMNANCRVPLTFGLVHCPARRTALVVGVGVGIATKMTYDAFRDGRLSVSLPFIGGR